MGAAQVISRGMQHRRKGSHELNVESSRSHSIMTVYCHASAEEDDETGASLATMGKINFVDLVSRSGRSISTSKVKPLCMPTTQVVASSEDGSAVTAGTWHCSYKQAVVSTALLNRPLQHGGGA